MELFGVLVLQSEYGFAVCLPFMNSPFSNLVCGHCVEWFICIALLVVSSFTLETVLCVCYMVCLHCINLFLILVGITYKCLILIGQTHTQDSHAYSLLGGMLCSHFGLYIHLTHLCTPHVSPALSRINILSLLGTLVVNSGGSNNKKKTSLSEPINPRLSKITHISRLWLGL